MCSESAVFSEHVGKAGAPADDIEVTPEMIEAGFEEFCGHHIIDLEDGALREALKDSYLVMLDIARKSCPKCS